ncbi:MAG TPA: esterase [Bacteroidia bacterium]|nr:esterase [Bacteroidia bacterium]
MYLFVYLEKVETVKEQHKRWHSPILGKEMDMLVFGEKGYPIIIFPTSMGSYTQNKDFHLIDSVSWFVDHGLVKIYTPGSVDNESWYNEKIHPADRARNHILYDQFMMEEVVKPVLQETGHSKAAFAGCSFGAYHATNFGFRHPEVTGYIINMGGAFDIKNRVKGYYDDNVYFNNPPDYLPGLDDPRLKEIGLIFGTGTNDMCMDANVQMSNVLNQKGIPHYLDIQQGAVHDWPVWREMFPKYLGMMKFN